MKHTAGQRRIKNDSVNFKHQGIFQRLMARPLFTMAWIAVCIACIMLAVLVFNPRPNSPSMLSSYLQSGPNIFRTKIPAEIRKEAKIFRAKVPVFHLPVKQVTKAESDIIAENQITAAQPMAAALQKTEPGQEAELRSTLESQDKKVIIPPKATALSSQPIVEVPEQGEPEEDSRLHPSAESEIKTITTPPLAKTEPPQTVVTPLPKVEVMKKTDLRQPMETPVLNGLETSAANSPPSQPPVSATKRNQPGQAAQSIGRQTSQFNIEPIVTAEQPSATLQSSDPGLQQKEKPEKSELQQSEVRLQPVKEIVKENTEERIIRSEKWLLSQESSRYTIQIMGARDDALLFDFVNRNHLLEQNEIAYYQTTFKGRPWFQLLYGIYPSKQDAQSAADAFPPKIRKSLPWIRRLSGVQGAIRKHVAQ